MRSQHIACDHLARQPSGVLISENFDLAMATIEPMEEAYHRETLVVRVPMTWTDKDAGSRYTLTLTLKSEELEES